MKPLREQVVIATKFGWNIVDGKPAPAAANPSTRTPPPARSHSRPMRWPTAVRVGVRDDRYNPAGMAVVGAATAGS
ncbi:hypothetical protein ACXPWS_00575 [Mycobacterium sp. BMJ-28]